MLHNEAHSLTRVLILIKAFSWLIILTLLTTIIVEKNDSLSKTSLWTIFCQKSFQEEVIDGNSGPIWGEVTLICMAKIYFPLKRQMLQTQSLWRNYCGRLWTSEHNKCKVLLKALHAGQCNRGDQWSIKAALLCLWALALFRGQWTLFCYISHR